jgi:hypothetical protein
VAHYETKTNLDSTVKSATATIYSGWSGQFNLSHGPCTETEEPTEVRAEVTFNDVCGVDDDTYTIFDRTGVVYKIGNGVVDPGTYKYNGGDTLTVNAFAASTDYVLKGADSFSFDFTDVACPVQTTDVRAKVTFKDVCGADDDSYKIFDRTGVVYRIGGDVVTPGTYDYHSGDTLTVTAEAANSSYVLKGDNTFNLDFTDVACPVKKKVTLCHATAAVKNPYRMITVNEAAADGVAGNSGQRPDHFSHTGPIFDPATATNGGGWGDIIPPVNNNGGLNWTAEGQAIYRNECQVPAKEVMPAAATFTLPTCEVKTGSYTIPTSEGVKYKVSLNGGAYQNVAAGTYDVAAGSTVSVKAVAKTNYTLTGKTTWSSDFPAATDCVLGDNDVCPNITGSQATVPSGMTKNAEGNCVTPMLGGQGGDVLGATTVLANTGGNNIVNFVVGILALGLALGTAVMSRRRIEA